MSGRWRPSGAFTFRLAAVVRSRQLGRNYGYLSKSSLRVPKPQRRSAAAALLPAAVVVNSRNERYPVNEQAQRRAEFGEFRYRSTSATSAGAKSFPTVACTRKQIGRRTRGLIVYLGLEEPPPSGFFVGYGRCANPSASFLEQAFLRPSVAASRVLTKRDPDHPDLQTLEKLWDMVVAIEPDAPFPEARPNAGPASLFLHSFFCLEATRVHRAASKGRQSTSTSMMMTIAPLRKSPRLFSHRTAYARESA